MSIECVQWAVEQCSVRGPDKAALVAIAYRAHPDGTGAYPSEERLVEESGFARRTVFNSIRRLARAGYLSVIYKGGPSGSNAYTLHLSTPVELLNGAYRELSDLAPRAQSTRHHVHSAPDAQCTTCQEPGTTCQVDLAPRATKPSIQPSKNQVRPKGAASSDAALADLPKGQKKKGRPAGTAERPKGVDLAEFYEVLKARGLPRIELFGQELRACGKLVAQYGAGPVVECWCDIGPPGQPSEFADLFVQRQRTFTKLLNGLFQQWLDWKAAGRPPLTKRGNGNGTGSTNTGGALRGDRQRPGADGPRGDTSGGAWHEQQPNW